MGAQESALTPEEPAGPQPEPTPAEERVVEISQPSPWAPVAPSPTPRPTGHPSLGRSASGHSGLHELGNQANMSSHPHRRHHTWHHAQRKRAYDQTVWDIQGHHMPMAMQQRSNASIESDSESEISEFSAPSVKRQHSRQPSEAGAPLPAALPHHTIASPVDLPTPRASAQARMPRAPPEARGQGWPSQRAGKATTR